MLVTWSALEAPDAPVPGVARAVTVGVALDRDHVDAVRCLQRRLGVPATERSSPPHITLVVVLEAPDRATVDAAVAAVAARTPAFTVRARGLGVFHDGGGGPVLHVPVVRTPELARLHQDVHDAVVAAGGVVEGRSAPASWSPHITLWDRGLTADRLACAVADLVSAPPIAWTVPVASLVTMDRHAVGAEVPLRRPPSPGG